MSQPDMMALAAPDYAAWWQQHAAQQSQQLQLNPLQSQLQFHVLLPVQAGEEAWVADTLDSLAAQTYGNWRLTVIADFAATDPLWTEHESLQWLTVAEWSALHLTLHRVLQLSTADWVLWLPAGCVLVEEALAYALHYSQRFPAWRLLYSDEDVLNANQGFEAPQFKPDFNLDLLRSTPYVGVCCWCQRESLVALGGMPALSQAEVFALSLLYADTFGAEAIGHVAQILLHIPAFLAQKFNHANGALALQAHLQRNQLSAEVKPGFTPQSYFVDYALTATPRVTLIITVRQVADVQPCLQAIVSKTHYPNYAIVLLDHSGVLTPASVQPFAAQVHIEIQTAPQPDQTGATATLAPQVLPQLLNPSVQATPADGFVLFLAADCVVVQEDWLARLLAIGLRPEVGLVSARLLNAEQQVLHAGIILGMGDLGVAGYWQQGLALTDAGYMSRAWLTQNFAALPLACLLVRRSVFEAVGGLSTLFSQSLFSEVDFGLRVGQLGYKAVWTPFVSLLYAGSQLLPATQDLQQTIAIRREADQFIKCWLPALADDPAFNRHLSLKFNFPKIELLTQVTWDPALAEQLKIWAFPVNDTGVGEYRVRSPLRALAQAGLAQISLLPNHSERVLPDIVEIARGKPDVLLLQNGHLQFLENAWQSYAEFNQVFMIYAQDDLVYNLPDKHPFKEQWPKDLRRRLKQLFSYSDRLIVANEILAQEFGQFIADVRIVPNYLEKGRWLGLDQPRERQRGQLPRVGWAGAGQHHGDLEFLLPVLQATYKQVDWIFFGMCPESLKPYVAEFHVGVAFADYPAKLASLDLDLAIAPLAYNKFNQAKTNLRLLEYGVMGWPVVCTDIQPYKNAPVTRLPNGTKVWVETILQKVHEPAALKAEGRCLQQWVMANFLLEDHLDAWLQALKP